MLYGSAVWTMGRVDQISLQIWEGKTLRNIYDEKKGEGVWQRRNNKELEELYEVLNIVKVIKGQKMWWMAHLIRMQHSRMPKLLLESKVRARKR